MLFKRAVREIKAENIDTIIDHGLDDSRFCTRRAERSNYLGLYHLRHPLTDSIPHSISEFKYPLATIAGSSLNFRIISKIFGLGKTADQRHCVFHECIGDTVTFGV